MIDLDLFSDISRDVATATSFVKKIANSRHLSLSLRNGLEYRYINVHIRPITI